MNTLLIVLAFVCLLVGIVATFTPVPPAVPVAWLGLLLARLGGVPIGTSGLVWAAVVGVVLMVLDYVLPPLATRRFGGSKWGVWGCTVGLLLGVVGLPFGPSGLVGVFFWPFAGAFVGECLHGLLVPRAEGSQPAGIGASLRAAVGAFLGLMSGTLAKVVYAVVLIVCVVCAML